MHKVYMAKGVQATTAIEGNTLSEAEVRLKMENKLLLPPSKEYLGREVGNVIQLCNEIRDRLASGQDIPITVDEICRYNAVILQNVPVAEHVVPGRFREVVVGVGNYRAPDPAVVPEMMTRLCDWLNGSYFTVDETMPAVNSIVKAIVAHLYMAWIHPFGDGNGRTARILEFAILLRSGMPTPAAHLLSNHYNATRAEYYRQLGMASKKQDPCDFIGYAVQGLLDGLREQLEYVFAQVLSISWESFVYETFRSYKHHESVTKRRRTLALELSRRPQPVPEEKAEELRQVLIDVYRDKTTKTVLRDLKELVELKLIEKTEQGYQALVSRILAFVPVPAVTTPGPVVQGDQPPPGGPAQT
jgi:Fic family protein